ncbi:MAG TPA: hypothetical protein VJQ77_05965 [Novosphingobium sp.]|nr:hypothetical protein [Novosphingobium sp.]
MSVSREEELSPQELALKIATAEAVRAAGGQEFVAREVGRAQSRISDYCSRTTRQFVPADVAVMIDALGTGRPGHPHIASAMARAQGAAIEGSAPARRHLHLHEWLADLSGESADVIRALVAGSVIPGQAVPSIQLMSANDRATVLRELDELADVVASLRMKLEHADTS